MIASERETVINTTDDDDFVTIYTGQRKYINRLRKHPKYTLVREEIFEGTTFCTFTIPASEWNPATGAKRDRAMTDEQRAAAAERLKKARGSK